jgi:hypothetical protein
MTDTDTRETFPVVVRRQQSVVAGSVTLEGHI